MKYWEIAADKLSAGGWSWGYCSAVTIVHSDELLSAFLELEAPVVGFLLDNRVAFLSKTP
jgi:hypothetical protein